MGLLFFPKALLFSIQVLSVPSMLFSTLLTEYSKTTSATLLALMDPENMKSILHAFQAGRFCY